jgi:hypothetical protein
MNLADLNDLFERGADKVGKALPRVFAKGAEAWIFLHGGQEVSVRRDLGLKQGGQIKVQAKVVLDLGRGEGWVIPVEGFTSDVELDGLGCDPARECRVTKRVPREALATEEGRG